MNYNATKVVCPFYQDDSPKSIICEGVFSRFCVQNFSEGEKKKAHIKNVCACNDYKKCEIAKILSKKYD